MTDGRDSDGPPVLVRVVRGHPTDEEIAALVTVLAARAAAAAARPAHRPPDWSAYWRTVRRTGGAGWPHGPGGWRSSALPR